MVAGVGGGMLRMPLSDIRISGFSSNAQFPLDIALYWQWNLKALAVHFAIDYVENLFVV